MSPFQTVTKPMRFMSPATLTALLSSLLCSCTVSPVGPEPAASGPQLSFETAEPGDVAAQARAFSARARAQGRQPLIYVGASWCEPCRYFHAAAERGELDGSLPRLALLEFDRDTDGPRLDAAGYASRMIPLFVVPGEDGRGTDARIEGSIHGPGSPNQIAPRLRAILAP